MDRNQAFRDMVEHQLKNQEMPAPVLLEEYIGYMETDERSRPVQNLISAPVATPPRPRGDAEWSVERQQTIERMFAVGMPIPEPTDIQYAIDDLIYKLNEAREKLALFGAWLDGEEPE